MVTLREREIYNDNNLKLLVVERMDIQHSKTNSCCHIYVKIETLSVIVYDKRGQTSIFHEVTNNRLDRNGRSDPVMD